MGNQCCGDLNESRVKRNYTDCDKKEEFFIRRFEETEWIVMKDTFANLRYRIRFQKNNLIKISAFKKMLTQELRNSNHIISIIEYTPFFEEKSGYYNVLKLKLLLLLWSKPEKYIFKERVYYDKASFIVQEVQKNMEEDLNDDIEYDNNFFVTIIRDLVEITDIITKYYLNLNAITLKEYFDTMLKTPIETIVQYIIKDVSQLKNIKVKTYNTNVLEKIEKQEEADKEEKKDDNKIKNYDEISTSTDVSDLIINVKKQRLVKLNPATDNKEKIIAINHLDDCYETNDLNLETEISKDKLNSKLKIKDKAKYKSVMSFNFYDINKKFFYNNYYLTTGYIREIAYQLHMINSPKVKLNTAS